MTPWVARLLRGSVRPAAFESHLRFLIGGGVTTSEPALTLNVKHLEEELDGARERYRDLLFSLYEARDREEPLRPFFENLLSTWVAAGIDLSLVLIFDQFEEIFTRFVPPRRFTEAERHDSLPDYRLGRRLFGELADLVSAGPDDDASNAGTLITPRKLPVRIVFSLRKEYLADLRTQIDTFSPVSDTSLYGLMPLDREAAGQAIRNPAWIFHRDSEGTDDLLDQLVEEEGWIEPTVLQITCSRLWELAESSDTPISASLLGGRGVPGVVESFFELLLTRLEDDERVELLDSDTRGR